MYKKRGAQRSKERPADEVAGDEAAQKTEKMRAEICSFSAGAKEGEEGET